LIDTFRFIDRAFRDIGDKFFIDINKVTNLIKGEYNKSFFDVSNQILTDNNFNFIPLPNFINFNDKDELESIFKPYSYNDIVTFNGTGPSFICCFVGQTSTNLDLGLNSMYPDDGFSINRGENLPDDFEGVPDVKNGDMYVPVFSVNYGQQNQNYFKNVKLDQREFSETMESLEIIEDLSQTGDKSKATFVGNNLFNVYQTRSYSAEVEMLGSAMIQPMMYFQLNNIPMFRGAYLIYKVNHKITPHNMVTTFKGNRVKRTKTPLLDEATLYMNLVGTQTGGRIGSSNRFSGNAAPILKTLIENGCSSSNINSGQIKPCSVPSIPGIQWELGPNTEDKKTMICEAVQPLTEMLKDWVSWMKEQGFVGKNNGTIYAYITSMFRTGGGSNSMHNFGLAIDLQFFKKNGTTISNRSKSGGRWSESEYFSFDDKNNPALKWMYNHAYEYGFAQPFWANDGRNATKSDGEEHWHWEYHGKSAICILRKQPIPGLGNNSPSDNPLDQIQESKIKPFVKNPKNPDGSEAVYIGCDYSKVSYSDKKTEGKSDYIITDADKINNIKKITQMFKRLGITKEGAIGFIGNILGESKANPSAIEKKNQPIIGGKGGIGIVQWTANRRRELEKQANNNSDNVLNLDFQINYLEQELKTKYKTTVLEPLKIINDIKQSTVLVLEKFEIPLAVINKNKNLDAYQKTVNKRFSLSLAAEDIVNQVYS
jgi:hypothetical protein